MKIALTSCANSGVDFRSTSRVCELEYAHDVVLLSADPSKLHVFP